MASFKLGYEINFDFSREARQGRGEVQQNPICNLNISLPEEINPEPGNVSDQELLAIQSKYSFLREAGYGKFDTIHRADLRYFLAAD